MRARPKRRRNVKQEREYARAYRAANADKVRQIKRDWNSENRGRINAQQRARYHKENAKWRAWGKAWREKNHTRLLEIEQARRDKDTEAVRRKNREWAANNRDNVRSKWWKNRERYSTQMFERDIENLPNDVKDMRRLLLQFKRWLKANNYTLQSLAEP